MADFQNLKIVICVEIVIINVNNRKCQAGSENIICIPGFFCNENKTYLHKNDKTEIKNGVYGEAITINACLNL